MDTIREQIISAFLDKIAEIKISNGYNTDCGNEVLRAIKLIDPDRLPVVAIYPQPEEAEKQYGKMLCNMPIRIECIEAFGSDSPSLVAEKMLGDIIENILGTYWILPFTTGTHEIIVGNTIIGMSSNATGYVADVEITSGTWAGGNASGNLGLRRVSGAFELENIEVSSVLSALVSGNSITTETAINSTTNGFAESIQYVGGGTDEYPNDENLSVGTSAVFEIQYFTETGNPYSQ